MRARLQELVMQYEHYSNKAQADYDERWPGETAYDSCEEEGYGESLLQMAQDYTLVANDLKRLLKAAGEGSVLADDKRARLQAMPKNILVIAEAQRQAASKEALAGHAGDDYDENLYHYLRGKVDANESTACYVTQELRHAGLLPGEEKKGEDDG